MEKFALPTALAAKRQVRACLRRHGIFPALGHGQFTLPRPRAAGVGCQEQVLSQQPDVPLLDAINHEHRRVVAV